MIIVIKKNSKKKALINQVENCMYGKERSILLDRYKTLYNTGDETVATCGLYSRALSVVSECKKHSSLSQDLQYPNAMCNAPEVFTKCNIF
jgi:hypothetical protein